MNAISIISVSVAVIGLVLSTIWNIINAKKSTNAEYQNIIELIRKESIQQGETKALFQQMSNSLQQIVEDNKHMNDKIYELTGRITLIEHDQSSLVTLYTQLSNLDERLNKLGQRIELLEHDLKKSQNFSKTMCLT